jgi:PEP-CTERM motif
MGTDVKVWLANLQGAPSVSAIDNARFSSLFFVTFEFRSSSGTSYDITTTTALTPEGGARVLGPSRTWARLLPGAFTLYTLGSTAGTDAGIGGCDAGESAIGYPLFANAYSTCGDGSWLTYSFSTTGLWSVDGIMMMDFALGSVFDDGATTSGSQLCYSNRFNMVPPSNCNIRSDATYDGLPDVAVIVPEPGTGMLVTAGMAGLGLVLRRRTRRRQSERR